MICMDSNHPDIEEFVDLKSDLDKATKANLSVMADNAFMEAATNTDNSDYDTTFKNTATGETITKKIDAASLFSRIAQRNWEMAEPGMLFYDNINNHHILSEYDNVDIKCPNPCVTGDTMILTDKGYVDIESCVDTEVTVWNGYAYSDVTPTKTGEDVDTCIVRFSNGSELQCTPYHKFILKDGTRVECKDLSVGDKLVKCNMPIINGEQQIEHAYTQGFYSGCGYTEDDISIVEFWDDKQQCMDRCDILSVNKDENSKRKISCQVACDHDLTFAPIKNYGIKSKIEWLSGLCDASGYASKEGVIAIVSTNKEFLRDVFYVIQTLGISGTMIRCEESEMSNFPEGIGDRKLNHMDLWRLVICNNDVLHLKQLGFNPMICQSRYARIREATRYITVESIEPAEKADVFCFTEPQNHSGIFNGIITAQCGEIPMEAGSACLLSSINLSAYVDTNTKKFELEEFENDVQTIVTEMERVQEESIPLLPLEIQKDQAKGWRRIGVGIMGLADMLIKLEVKYGSQDALNICDIIGDTMARAAIKASERYAIEHGSFRYFDRDKINNSEYMKLHNVEVKGLRNASLLCVAPTGSLSTMLNISGGTEPLFDISYTRKTESLNGDDTYYEIYAPIVKDYMRKHGIEDASELPDFFATAKQIHWSDRVKMQAVWQRHIDQAISSTVNLPESTTVEDIKKIYELAWHSGLKGVTIYRENCDRTGILTSDKQVIKPVKPIRTPDDSVGKQRKLDTGCGRLHCQGFFDKNSGMLLETWLNKGSGGGCRCNLTAISRLITLCLRSGVDLYDVLDQLNSVGACGAYTNRTVTKHDTSPGTSCPTAIAKAMLDMYNVMSEEIDRGMYYPWLDDDDMDLEEDNHNAVIQGNTNKKIPKPSYSKCPECGEMAYIASGGCGECTSCGYSRCT